MTYKKGDRVLIRFTGQVEAQDKVNSTCEVTEKAGAGEGFTHYVYLNGSRARNQVLAGGSAYDEFRDPAIGDTVEVSFEAVIDSLKDGPNNTSTVQSVAQAGEQAYYHCIYLDSPSVTPLTGAKAEGLAATAGARAAAAPSGQPVQACFTATVMNGRGAYATTRVRDAAGADHYLYLGQGEPCEAILGTRKAPEDGDTITVTLDGVVRTTADGYEKPTLLASGVYVQTTKGWNHCLNLASPFVTLLPAEGEKKAAEASPEPEPEEPPGGYPENQELRVEFEAVVLTSDTQKAGTSQVREGNGCVHYLFLRREDARRQLGLTGSAPVAGDTIRVSFTTRAAARDRQGDGPDSATVAYTTGATGSYLHYVFLGSPSVKPVRLAESKEETTEEGKEPVTYKQGDEFRAEFTAVVRDTSSVVYSCDRLEEDGNGKTHYLYLQADVSRKTVLAGDVTARPRIGDRVTVAFTGKVTEFGEQRNGTRAVSSPKVSGIGGRWNHALDLSSPSVRLLKASELPLFTQDSAAITSAAVIERLADLRGTAGYTVTRDRTGEIVFRAATEDACTTWLSDEDYNAAKFTVAGRALSTAQAEEVRELALLLDSVSTRLGTTWALYGKGYFTEDWARAQAQAQGLLSGTGYELGNWPFDLIPWAAAATAKRDADYLAFRFAGADFYGKRP